MNLSYLKIRLLLLIVAVVTLSFYTKKDSLFDKYGGCKEITNKSTGFFYLDTRGDKYFLFTPEGNGYRALGVNHVPWRIDDDKADAIVKNIKDWGFNAGDYQGPEWLWNRIPYLQGITLVSTSSFYSKKQFHFEDVFDSTYLNKLDSIIKKTVEPQAQNKMLIGYFWTDIPIWTKKKQGLDWLTFFKQLDDSTTGKKVWNNWKTANPDLPEQDFLGVVAKQIYSNAHKITLKYDENHLIFGDRYRSDDIPEVVVQEALPYIDAIAIQPWGSKLELNYFDSIYNVYKKPIYIADHVSSFATKEHPVTMGQVAKDEKSYVKYYENYITSVFSLPYIIGYNKCQYKNAVRPTLLKQGLVQENGEPYNVVNGIRKANLKALEIAYDVK